MVGRESPFYQILTLTFMNQSKAKQLRKLFVSPYKAKDPRNKKAWRRLKREYNGIPRDMRHLFLEALVKFQADIKATSVSSHS